jgi:hypothetical protein
MPADTSRIFSADEFRKVMRLFANRHKHAVRHRFKDGLRTAGILLLLTIAWTPKAFRLIADQFVQMGVVDRNRHLPAIALTRLSIRR